MKTMQELLEGLNSATLSIWKDACERHASMLKCTLETANSLVHLIEIHNQFHTTKWALSQIETELKRRDELAEANRKALGLDQPDLGEQLWIDGYGEQLDQERQRRKAELNKINRLRVRLPPFAKIPVKEKEGAEQGWVELETIVHIDGEALKEGAVVSIVRKHQEDRKKRVCGNCVRRIETPEYPYGWCSWGGFPATVNGAGPEHCGNFDPRPVKEVPTFEASNGDKLLKVCGNCVNWKQKGERVDDGDCGGAYRNAADFTCPEFDPIPLPQTPPAEAVAALDHLPTPEEFDPNDPRR